MSEDIAKLQSTAEEALTRNTIRRTTAQDALTAARDTLAQLDAARATLLNVLKLVAPNSTYLTTPDGEPAAPPVAPPVEAALPTANVVEAARGAIMEAFNAKPGGSFTRGDLALAVHRRVPSVTKEQAERTFPALVKQGLLVQNGPRGALWYTRPTEQPVVAAGPPAAAEPVASPFASDAGDVHAPSDSAS